MNLIHKNVPLLEELATATAKMRKLQKEYFQNRTNKKLNEAKAAETEVDQLLAQLAPMNVGVRANLGEQTTLFNQ